MTKASKREFSEEEIRNYTLYALSLPERVLRTGLGLLGGAAKQTGELLLPQAFKSSETYTTFITQSLDFLITDCGGLTDREDNPKDQFIARKAVGNFIELASFRLLPVSPAFLLAMIADTAYGSQKYLQVLVAELRDEGYIAKDTMIQSTSDLLNAINAAAADTAKKLDTPPLNVTEINDALAGVRGSVKSVEGKAQITRGEIDELWQDLVRTAKDTNQSVLNLSTVTAMKIGKNIRPILQTSTRATRQMFEEAFVRETKANLAHIREVGFYTAVREQCRPYVANVHKNFGAGKSTLTNYLLTSGVVGEQIDRVLGRKKKRGGPT